MKSFHLPYVSACVHRCSSNGVYMPLTGFCCLTMLKHSIQSPDDCCSGLITLMRCFADAQVSSEEPSSSDERRRTTRGQAAAAGGEYRHAVLRDELDDRWQDELEEDDDDGDGGGGGGGGRGARCSIAIAIAIAIAPCAGA